MKYLNENTLASPTVALAVRVAIVFAVIGCMIPKVTSAADDDYLYCYASDREEKVTYFSEIFLGDYVYDSFRAQRNFLRDLRDAGINARYFSLSGLCTFKNTYKEAQIELEYDALQKQRFPYDGWTVVRTNWKPGYSGPLSLSNSNDSYGRESGGDGCYFGECPDGVSPSQNTICQTLEGWCENSENLPVGKHCYCIGQYGQDLEGITLPKE